MRLRIFSVLVFVVIGIAVVNASTPNDEDLVVPFELVDRTTEIEPTVKEPLSFIATESTRGAHDDSINLHAFPQGGIRIPKSPSFPLELRVTESGWWAPPYILETRPVASDLPTWVLYRTEETFFPVEVWNGPKAPPDARAVFCGCADRFGAPTKPCGEAEVHVEGTRYRIDLPKGCVDLEIITQDFAPVNLDTVIVGAPVDKKKILLLRGGSIRGTVISAIDGLPIAATSISARPLFVTHADLGETQLTERITEVRYGGGDSSKSFETSSNLRGRFRLAGLEPGIYRLSFSKEGLAQLVLDSVEAFEDTEVSLEFVEMGPGATVTAMVSPPSCYSESLEVLLLRKMNETGAIVVNSLPISSDGTAAFAGLAEGGYIIDVHGRCGASDSRSVGSMGFSLLYGDDLFLPVSLDVCEVSGRIRRDGDAVNGRIQCRKWGHNAGFEFNADESGYFEAFFPGPGNYDFDVETEDFRTNVSVEDLRCSDNIKIDLPSSFIAGIVNDEDGNPVVAAAIEAQQQMDEQSTLHRPLRLLATSGPDGHFAIEGPQAGSWDLHATDKERQSDIMPIVIQDDDDGHEDIVLVIRERQTIELLSVDEVTGTALPGVKFAVNWSRPGGSPLSTDHASLLTDLQGRAELEIPKAVPEFRIVTTADRRPIIWGQYRNEETVSCPVPPGPGGTLILQRSNGRWLSSGLPVTLVRHRGSLVNPIELILQFGYGTLGEEQDLNLGPLAPGGYDIIFVNSIENLNLLISQPSIYPADENVNIPAGGTVTVMAPF